MAVVLDRSQIDQAPKSALSVEQQREIYWRDLAPLLSELNDWQLSILGLFTFWSGEGVPPDAWVRKSCPSLQDRLGGVRKQGSSPAKRHVVVSNANQLVELGLLERKRGRKWSEQCLWRLKAPRPASSTVNWPGFYSYNARHFRRDGFQGGVRLRAGICRLSYILDESGKWEGPKKDLCQVLGVSTVRTVDDRLTQIERADNAIKIERDWANVKITFKAPATASRLSVAELEQRKTVLRDQLDYPELVEEAIKRANRLRKSGKLSATNEINGFYEPALALQKQLNNPPLFKYALGETLNSDVFRGAKGKSTRGWIKYAARVATNNRHKFLKGSDAEVEIVTGVEDDGTPALRKRELAMRELLERASRLNGTGERDQAQKLLPEILEAAGDLAELFAGDQAACERALRLSFKQGDTDFVGVKVDEYAFDFWPDWQPAITA